MATLGLKEMGKFLWEGREKKFAQLPMDAMPLSLKNLLLKSTQYKKLASSALRLTLLKFEILQITIENEPKNIRLLVFSFSLINLAF